MSDRSITVTNINIRESIAVLLTKLVFVDIFAAICVVGFYFLLVQGERFALDLSQDTYLFFIMFLIVGAIKIILDIYIVLQWLNEYYEITPDNIIYKSGIIHKKTRMFRLNLIRAMNVNDTFLGEIFNFATITLYDIRMNKYLDMYLIHNADRYAKIIKSLLPEIEIKKDRTALPFLSKNTDDY